MTTHRPTMSDPVDVLAGARPTAAELDAQFSPERAVALLDRVRTAASEPIALTSARPAAPRRGRRWLAVAAVAAVGPSLISPQSASATALSHLATTAASQDDGPIPAGKYVHLSITETQSGAAVVGDPPQPGAQAPTAQPASGTFTREVWIRADGMTWFKDMVDGRTFTWTANQGTALFSPSTVASLPTTADDLEAWLRANSSGSNSPNEAVFAAVGDLLRTGYVPPTVARAAITVLGRLPEVRTETAQTPSGAAGVKVIFDDQQVRTGHHYLLFDPNSADLVEEGVSDGGTSSYRSTTSYHPLADAVPTSVTQSAIDPSQQVKPT